MSQPVQPPGLLANDQSSEYLHINGIEHNKSNIEARIRARRLSINNRELLLAISENNFGRVVELVNGDIDIHFKDRDGYTPLQWAVETQNCEIIELLLRKEQELMRERDESFIDYAKTVDRPDILQLLQNFLHTKVQMKDKKFNEGQFEIKGIEQIHSENNNEIDCKVADKVKSIRTNNIECIKTDEVLGQLDQSIGSTFKTFEPDGTKKKTKKYKKNVTAIHGYIYQLKLLMLFLYRGVSQRYSFSLGTEIAEAKKFDDLVFEYVQDNKKIYRLLQAKHKQDESKKITAYNLLSEKNGDYNLVKYFLSYQNSKKEKLFEGGLIKDVTICTNINWDYKDLENAGITLVQMKTEDDIFIVKSIEKEPQCYKFGDNVALLLKSKLKECITVQSTKQHIQHSDDDIKDFLDHLVFAVNQPNEEELGKIVQNEMGKEFGLISTENVYNKVFVKLLKWLMDKKEDRFLSYKRGKEFFEQARTGIPVWFNVKNSTSVFVGRVHELKDLHKMLQRTNKNAAQIVSICGLGGVGKSELVKQYINRYSKQYDNKVVWINAETYKTLAESFYRLARDNLNISTLNTDNKQKEICSIVEDVYKFFADGKCLFIFDNAEKYKSDKEFDHGIESFLPSLPPSYNRPFILITSRNKKWPENVQILQLNVFNEDDAVKLITTSLCIKNNVHGDDIKEFVRELHYLPLALQQGIAYINAQGQKLQNIGLTFTVHDYVKRYKEKVEVLNFRFPDCSDNDYSKTIFTTWNVTLDMIHEKEDGNDALMILYIASYFAPEDIPIEIFLGVIDDKDKVASAVELLKQYSMVNVDHTVLNVHRLVQQVIRVKLKMQNREEVILNSALRLFKHTVNSDNINHAISLCAYTREHSILLGGTLKLLRAIVEEMADNARFEEANLFNEQILQLLDTVPQNAEHVIHARLATKNNTGIIWLEQGKYNLALKTFPEILDNLKLLGMENSAEYMVVKSNLAHTLYFQGEYNKALESYQHVYNWYANLKDCAYELNIIKADIAAILLKQGKFDKALSMLQEVCKDQERTLGADNPLLMKTKGKIAVVLIEQGKLDESLEMLKVILSTEKDMQKKGCGVSSVTKYHIALIFSLQGKHTKASKMLNEILKVEEKIRGKDHPEVLSTRRELVDVMKHQGKVEEAKAMCEDILNRQKRILTPHHPDILRTLYLKASILDMQEDYDSAMKIYQEVLTRWRTTNHSSDHLQICKVLSVIGLIHAKQGNHNKGLELAQEALSIQTQLLGENHIDTLTTMNNMGLILHNKAEFSRALDIFNEVFRKLKAINNYRMHEAKSNVAYAFVGLGKYDTAMKLYTEVYDAYKQNFTDGCYCGITTKNNMAAVLVSQRRYMEALDLFRDVYKELSKTFRPGNPSTITVVHSIRATLLHMIANNDIDTMQSFFEKDKNVILKRSENPSLTDVAVDMNRIEALKVLMKYGIDVTSDDLNRLLHKVAAIGNAHIMQLLLQYISSNKLTDCINVKAGINEDTPLHVAVRHGCLAIVELLLQHGAFYDIQNSNGGTPLNISFERNITNLLELLDKLFQAAKAGDHQLISVVGQLKRDQFEIVSAVRNRLNHTLLQTIKVNNRKKLLQKYMELALSSSYTL